MARVPATLEARSAARQLISVPVDLDRDGWADLLAFQNSPGPAVSTLVFEDGTLVPGSTVQEALVWHEVTDAADLDGDGQDELLLVNPDQCSLAALYGEAADEPGVQRLIEDGRCEFEAIHMADLDRDGVPELIATPGAQVFSQKQSKWILQGRFLTSDLQQIHVADLDGDGNPDVLGTRGDEVTVGLGGPTGIDFARYGFRAHQQFAPSSRPDQLLAGDLDGDGGQPACKRQRTQCQELPSRAASARIRYLSATE